MSSFFLDFRLKAAVSSSWLWSYFFLFNLYAYGFNAKFSNRLRSSPPLQDGINNFADVLHVLGSRKKLFLLMISWMLGLIPTVACFAAQIFWG
jgi:hypothetical protein